MYTESIKRIQVPEGALKASQLKEFAWQVFQYHYFEGIIIYARACDIPFYGMALSLMLKNLRRPVVFFSREEDELTAEAWASQGVNGIFAVADDGLDLACRTTCIDGRRLISPHYPQVGVWQVRRSFITQLLPPEEQDPFLMCDAMNENVIAFYPEDDLSQRRDIFDAKGILITLREPEDWQWLFEEQMPMLVKLHRKQIPVVVVGLPEEISEPAQRRQLLLSGVVSAGDMTREAASIKLMWTLARTASVSGVKLYFGLSFAGEVTQH